MKHDFLYLIMIYNDTKLYGRFNPYTSINIKNLINSFEFEVY